MQRPRLQPHEYFRAEFDAILEEGKRQERVDPQNRGEAEIVSNMHAYFAQEVAPSILRDDWVYDAALRFAKGYASECFLSWKLSGHVVLDTQRNLWRAKSRISDFLERANQLGAVRKSTLTLVESKASNFLQTIRLYSLPADLRHEARELYSEAIDQEALQIRVVVRAIPEIYAKILPRVMFVVRRVMVSSTSEVGDLQYDTLADVSDTLDWYEKFADSSHPLFPVLGNLRRFYRIVRNTANHPEDYTWHPDDERVSFRYQMKGVEHTLIVHSRELMQKYRYLVYVCELGMRGICAAVSAREQGALSNQLVRDYAKTFPADFPSGMEAEIIFY